MEDPRHASGSETATLKVEALDTTLDMLGQNSKKALLFHLESCNISVNPHRNFSLQQLQAALKQVLGESGAELILEHVILEMDRMVDVHAARCHNLPNNSSRTTFHGS